MANVIYHMIPPEIIQISVNLYASLDLAVFMDRIYITFICSIVKLLEMASFSRGKSSLYFGNEVFDLSFPIPRELKKEIEYKNAG